MLEFNVNIDQIAERLGVKREVIEGRLQEEVKKLAATTHAFVVNYAQQKLAQNDFMRKWFFGEVNSRTGESEKVRFHDMGNNMYVVELDESNRWIEEGREPTSMATDKWLLKGPNVKTAKDGSKYRVIPMKQMGGVGGKHGSGSPQFDAILKKALKEKSISLNRVERDTNGSPKLGVLHKLSIPMPSQGDGGFHQMTSPNKFKFFSKGRSPEQARSLGLKASAGHFYLSNAVVTQTLSKGPRGQQKVEKGVTTFRVVSSKHEAEGKWMYTRVEPLGSIPAAYNNAMQMWNEVVRGLEDEFSKSGE
jgi:hypothetical protein